MNYFMELNDKNIDREIDAHCKRLCDDMILFWNKRCQQIGNQVIAEVEDQPKCFNAQDGSSSFSIWQKTEPEQVKMTCDFIGPSQYYAEKQDITQSDILIYNIRTRVLGGHMVWPSMQISTNLHGEQTKKSINTGRASCFKDRIDYTLWALKTWYSPSNSNLNEETKAFKEILDGNSLWLHSFGESDDGYRGFIDFFVLNDFVTEETYIPYDLSSFRDSKYSATITGLIKKSTEYVPQGKDAFQTLIDGCQYAIGKREDTLMNLMKS